MAVGPRDLASFVPAQSAAEAITRIYSLTGAAPARTRGEKRAIVALRDALGLDLEMAQTNAVMGERIAHELGVEWRPTHIDPNTVTLAGLNALLLAAPAAFRQGSLRRLAAHRPSGLDGPQWDAFQPARSKIEAVNRISGLTASGAEWLGPGSKEHKRVLINLATRLGLDVDVRRTKTELGADIATILEAPWSDDCASTGETITLAGLNTLLAGAERRLDRLGSSGSLVLGSPEEEGEALAAALLDGWRAEDQADGGRRVVWDARRCIQWMVDQGVTNGPNHNEWQGFYWEAMGRAILNDAFTQAPDPPRLRFGNTAFDYSLTYVWDLKAHTESWRFPSSGQVRSGQSSAPLNDQQAMDECIAEQGLGFLVVGGIAIADEDEAFVRWHRQFKLAQGRRPTPSNSGRSRLRKAAFEPLHVEALFFRDPADLGAAIAAGQITGFRQGMQAPRHEGVQGQARRPKYNLAVTRARRAGRAVARFGGRRREP